MMDLVRLQKALSVEAERGFNNLEGNQYHFGEFLHLNFSQPDGALPDPDRARCQEIASQFANYVDLTFSQRQHLVAETRRFLYQVKKTADEIEKKATSPDQSSVKKGVATSRTSPIVDNRNISLDQALTYLPGVGPKSAEKLAKLGLLTVRDMLYYYPRDHLDYARQVTIRELQAGETVTLIGTVKSCSCFTSPRNSKLTIVELVIRDSTGQMKISRFFAGTRYSNRGWSKKPSLA